MKTASLDLHPIAGTSRAESCGNRVGCLAASSDAEISRVSSAEQGHEERDSGNPRSSRAFNADCAGLIDKLANTVSAVLIRTQVAAGSGRPEANKPRVFPSLEARARLQDTVTAQEPDAASRGAVKLPSWMNTRPAPAFSQPKVNSQQGVMAVLARAFPKGDKW